ncbi:MAG: Holliday junction resolvase RecU [Bacilli bacterium]
MKYQTHFNNITTKNHSNRGMGLENDLNETNKFYLINNIANVHKKPTQVTIKKVDYHSKYDALIKEAYFKTPSTTDYNGVYQGKYIDFEAKETKLKTAFPLSNIHEHQIKHLTNIVKHGGIGFIIVRFTTLNETYILTENKLVYFQENIPKKSIPLSFFKEHGYLIKDKYCPRVDYLAIIDKILEGEKNEKV